LLELSGRRDGSSRFSTGKKYGLFWSIGGAWNVTNEKFLQDNRIISELKFRASIGTSGNDRVGDFQFFPLYAGGNAGAYNAVPGFVFTQPENLDYRWEQSKTTNFGIDVSLFKSRVSFSLDLYRKSSIDLILSKPVPATNGFTSIIGNFGEMENRGIEFDLSTTNIKTENFQWTTSFNIAKNINEVLALPGAAKDLDGRFFVPAANNSGASAQRAIVGYSINTFFLVRYVGVNPQTGNAEWLDRNDNITINPTDNDRVIVGDANPKFVGGITNNFKYKNFDLNVFANFSYGNDIYVSGLGFSQNLIGDFNKDPIVLDYWSTPGQDAFAPALTSPTRAIFNRTSTAQLRDGSFLRLKNVTLGYNLPNKMFGENSFIKSVRLYTTFTNILTLKNKNLNGIDPETTANTDNLGAGQTFFTPPQAKSFLFGVKLNF
jgi:TonB-dependent starch-binding outer membrane protein SusC